MEIKFSLDKQYNKSHFQVNHSDVYENEIIEVFSNKYIQAEIQNRISKIVGHLNSKRFLAVVGIMKKDKTQFRVITAYPANRRYIVKWNTEVNK